MQPRRRKRSKGRPNGRWQEDMTEKEGTTWIGKATLTTMEDIDGGLHPAVDGQSLDEMRPKSTIAVCIQIPQAKYFQFLSHIAEV